MSRVLLDTSAFIAGIEGEVNLAALPGEATISIMTVCELHHGVLMASDADRPSRLRALGTAQQGYDALPVDHRVAPRFGELMAKTRRERGARPDVADTLIAATALAYGLPILTRDRDFEAFSDVEVVLI